MGELLGTVTICVLQIHTGNVITKMHLRLFQPGLRLVEKVEQANQLKISNRTGKKKQPNQPETDDPNTTRPKRHKVMSQWSSCTAVRLNNTIVIQNSTVVRLSIAVASSLPY